MYIKDLYKQKKTVISTELFPPRKTKQLNNYQLEVKNGWDQGIRIWRGHRGPTKQIGRGLESL